MKNKNADLQGMALAELERLITNNLKN